MTEIPARVYVLMRRDTDLTPPTALSVLFGTRDDADRALTNLKTYDRFTQYSWVEVPTTLTGLVIRNTVRLEVAADGTPGELTVEQRPSDGFNLGVRSQVHPRPEVSGEVWSLTSGRTSTVVGVGLTPDLPDLSARVRSAAEVRRGPARSGEVRPDLP